MDVASGVLREKIGIPERGNVAVVPTLLAVRPVAFAGHQDSRVLADFSSFHVMPSVAKTTPGTRAARSPPPTRPSVGQRRSASLEGSRRGAGTSCIRCPADRLGRH